MTPAGWARRSWRWPAARTRKLAGLAHEALTAPAAVSFDAAQHLVSSAAGDRDGSEWQPSRGRSDGPGGRDSRGARGLRDRVARLLDFVSGPSA